MIEISNVTASYGKVEALNIRNLQFEDGVAYGVVGPNGAGKTTLFKTITNIITNYNGIITIDNVDVRQHNEVLVNVGLVLDGLSVYKSRTGWFNIRYFGGLRGGFDEMAARELAQELDIYGVLTKPVKTYSYGMQKKLILLIAVLSSPKVLILDEPFRGLDAETVKWFKKYLKKMKENGMMLIVSSHVQNDLEELCSRVFVIDRGRIVKEIDLVAEEQKMNRYVDTTNNQRFTEILTELGLQFETTDDAKVKTSITQSAWEQVTLRLQEEKITILELSRVSALEDHLN